MPLSSLQWHARLPSKFRVLDGVPAFDSSPLAEVHSISGKPMPRPPFKALLLLLLAGSPSSNAVTPVGTCRYDSSLGDWIYYYFEKKKADISC